MGRKRMKERSQSVSTNQIGIWLGNDDICCTGYTRLSDCPEIQTACLRIAEMIGSMTIYLMANTANGDVRIQNELSRLIDIHPNGNMTRSHWMTAIVMNMLLYGNGNSIVIPHTYEGYLRSLEPISASRVSFMPLGNSYREYRVLVDGIAKDPDNLMHFVYNPDPVYLWKGRGVTVTLRDIANNLKQGQKTINAFMASEFKPSIIVKVDALTDEFSSPAGRQKLLESYAKPAQTGEPWLIPAEQFSVEQVRPLSLSDLAISDTITLDKKAVAAVIGVPPYLLGVGEYKRDEMNNFVQTQIKAITTGLQQEMTRCLIANPDWYLFMNHWSLLDYDIKSISDVLLAGADRGFINGDEWRDRMHMSPAGLTEYNILENYIPIDKTGDQEKLRE